MKHYITISTKGVVSVHDVDADVCDYSALRAILAPLGVGWFEVVTIDMFSPYRYMMYVDEEGKFKGFDENLLASALYGNPFDFIVGNVAIFSNHGDAETYYIDDTELEPIMATLRNARIVSVPAGVL